MNDRIRWSFAADAKLLYDRHINDSERGIPAKSSGCSEFGRARTADPPRRLKNPRTPLAVGIRALAHIIKFRRRR